VQPITNRLAFTTEASLNESLVGTNNNGRVAFGLQLGNWVRPKDFLTAKHAVPVDIPRIRYEVLVREVRTGHTPPVADAGPDQIGVPAGSITLDASASYSPEGLALSFQWTQIDGSTVVLSSANTSKATFTAAEGQTCQFRVAVTDSLGGQAAARTTVTAKSVPSVQILNFSVNPAAITTNQSATLIWQVRNADTVSISPDLGTVAASGSVQVSPAATTTYTLTVVGGGSRATQTVTVTVNPPPPLPGNPPVVRISGPASFDSTSPLVVLNACGSSGTTALHYAWTTSSAAVTWYPTACSTYVQMPTYLTTYTFTLVVTDRFRRTSTATVTIRLVPGTP